jgi:serine O-acetyltransferase
VWSLIRTDYRRHRATGIRSLLGVVLLMQGFWASAVYRIAHRAAQVRQPVLRRGLRLFFLFIQKGCEIITGICLPDDCEVGAGLYIGHFGPIIVTTDAKIGDNCNLSQGVTIGRTQARGGFAGYPVIGNRVYVGPNAVIVGDLTIGDDAAIGAGAVVTKSVPPRAVMAGNPARIVSYQGSFEFVVYDGMETAPERVAALAARERDMVGTVE